MYSRVGLARAAGVAALACVVATLVAQTEGDALRRITIVAATVTGAVASAVLAFLLARPQKGAVVRSASLTMEGDTPSSSPGIPPLAPLRSASLERLQDDQGLESLSTTDELTGLVNRRGFMLLAEQHMRLAQRQRTPFALLFADLNGTQTINDTVGDDAGDRAIRDLARIFRATLRDCDIVARPGGDELIVLMSGVTHSTARVVQDRLRVALEHENARNPLYGLSMSMGVAVFDPAAPQSLRELLGEADRRMQESKSKRHPPSMLMLRRVARSA
jgi:diguanylate cyclase (GGDEF)-like protein